MQALLRKVEQGFEINKGGFQSLVSTKLRVRMRLVVAMRLQAQHLPSRLCTSSNTLSVQKKVTNETSC
jgi:hypothetical protein